jgi:alkaline phosphatase D
VQERVIEPANEILSLADYRLRHAAYRADPDLQRLHQRLPMVMMWDDHESANDSWERGAENHEVGEGDWEARKRAAMRAYREWLPVSDEPWRSYRIGDLLHLYLPETRLTARSEPLNLGAALAGVRDVPGALAAFRDGPWRDPRRTMLGAEQEKWLAQGLRQSARDGVRWQVLAQQVLMGSITLSPRSAGWIGADAAPEVKQRAQVGLAASRIGLPFNFDMWDGYPAARERLLRSAMDANANLIVLSGDSHNGWAFNLDVGGTPAGVDFGVQSVTSPGYETYLPRIDPKLVASTVVEHNPQLQWADTSNRGYMTLELTADRATNEWLFTDSVRQRSSRIAGRHRMSVVRGTNRLA